MKQSEVLKDAYDELYKLKKKLLDWAIENNNKHTTEFHRLIFYIDTILDRKSFRYYKHDDFQMSKTKILR